MTIPVKEFSFVEVLGAISGYLLVDQGFNRIHELIEHVMGGTIFTHQLTFVAPICIKELVRQFPNFNLDTNPSLASDIDILVAALKSKDDKVASALLRELQARWGDSFHVAPLSDFPDSLEIGGER